MCKIVAGVITALLYCSSVSKAGLGTTSADEALSNGYSVVIAKVREIKTATNSRDGTHLLTIEPLATIAGHFDPSSAAKLTLTITVDAVTSSIDVAPTSDTVVIAVIHGYERFGQPKMGIVSDVCTFMPGNAACATLTGLDDKKIMETLNRIREERAKAASDRANYIKPKK